MRIVRIEEIIEESPTIRTLRFRDQMCADARPGQFAMVWLPRIDELPMSVMIAGDGYAALTIRKHGVSSTALYNMGAGSMLGIRGPYGNSFDLKTGRVLLVGGGTGLVPLMRLARALVKNKRSKVTLIMGSRTKDEVVFEKLAKDLLRRVRGRVVVTTEDGSYGMKGLATDAAAREAKKNSFNMVYTCGPERMMKKVLEIAAENEIPAQASLERLMKCGIGICCSCCIDRYLVCKDGPVMDGQEVLKLPEFGVNARDKAGRLGPMW